MLPIVLVLLVASSALAAPSVSVDLYNYNELAPSNSLTGAAFELIDGGDINIYILTAQRVIEDLAKQRDSTSQAVAIAQTLAILGELSTGVSGDACEAAAAIDSFVGGRGGQATRSYLVRLANNIDLISQLATNPSALRYAVGSRGNCVGGGRSYQFEAAWDAVLDQASPYNLPLVNEQYCAARRLYSAFSSRSNNVGAAVTAASLPPVVKAVENSLGPLINFLRSVSNGAVSSQAAAAAKQALLA